VGEVGRNRALEGRGRDKRKAVWIAGIRSWLIVAGAVCVIVWPLRSLANAQNTGVDRATSQELTAYLKQNRLPLVGAQVMKDSAGGRQVVLYGFAASDAGKQDAEQRAAAFMGPPAPNIDDRIVVKPELANMTGQPQQGDNQAAPYNQGGEANSQGTQAGQAAGGLSFDSLYDQVQRYGIKSPPGE
jgi:hypothetical protein